MRIFRMRTGITLTLSPSDRTPLLALVNDRNAAQKHIWPTEIILRSADGIGLLTVSWSWR